MSRVAAGQSLAVNQLVDMEWRFGGELCVHVYIVQSEMVHTLSVTAADSDMNKIGNSFLQLKMVLNKGSGTEEVFMGICNKYQ